MWKHSIVIPKCGKNTDCGRLHKVYKMKICSPLSLRQSKENMIDQNNWLRRFNVI
jgi:hypothetical protein